MRLTSDSILPPELGCGYGSSLSISKSAIGLWAARWIYDLRRMRQHAFRCVRSSHFNILSISKSRNNIAGQQPQFGLSWDYMPAMRKCGCERVLGRRVEGVGREVRQVAIIQSAFGELDGEQSAA
jgi:hypothetical protein